MDVGYTADVLQILAKLPKKTMKENLIVNCLEDGERLSLNVGSIAQRKTVPILIWYTPYALYSTYFYYEIVCFMQ